jgi:hypothetical protein
MIRLACDTLSFIPDHSLSRLFPACAGIGPFRAPVVPFRCVFIGAPMRSMPLCRLWPGCP